jgi:hypothetical protein
MLTYFLDDFSENCSILKNFRSLFLDDVPTFDGSFGGRTEVSGAIGNFDPPRANGYQPAMGMGHVPRGFGP